MADNNVVNSDSVVNSNSDNVVNSSSDSAVVNNSDNAVNNSDNAVNNSDNAVNPNYDNTVVGSNSDNVVSLFDYSQWIAGVKGIGRGTCDILATIPAFLLTNAEKASAAIEACLPAGRQAIINLCMKRYTDGLRGHMDSFLQEGVSQKWTARDVMRGLNKVVGAQHALDGKFWEALVIIVFAHFLGRDNISINAQVPTGSRLKGLTDIELHVGNGRFLLELTSCLGSNWKKCLPEHCVEVVNPNTTSPQKEQQPFFLMVPSFTLNPSWVEEMKAMKCQPVSVFPSLIDGVVHLDAVIDALKSEIKKSVEPNRTATV